MDRIMKLLGYENINNIKIKKEFESTPPKCIKLMLKQLYYMRYHKFEQTIILDSDNWLIDGYTTYLIVKNIGKKYVKVRRRNEQSRTMEY